MKAMIMAAGVGSRLMPMTAGVPKPMIPLCNRPLMENSVLLLKQHGFDRIVANLYYRGESISNYFGRGKEFGVEMRYSREDKLMGTAGGVKRCVLFLDDTFVVLSGDALTDIDLTALLERHQQAGALASIALKEVEEVEQFGVVVLQDNERVKSFQEKPSRRSARSKLANTGIYIFEPEIFNYIPVGQEYDFGKEVFPALVKARAPFYGFTINDYWCDVGSLEMYRQAHDDVLNRRVEAHPQGKMYAAPGGRVLVGEGAQLGSEVVIKGSVSIGAGSSIGEGAVLENCVIWGDSVIEPGAEICGSIIGERCHIGAQSVIQSSAAIASGSVIPAKSRIRG